jgi:4-hydroxy-2-oxoheptanedioate aldolase
VTRINRLVEVLEAGGVASVGGFLPAGSPDHAMVYADLGYDAVLIETEHEGFSAPAIRQSLQFMLSPQQARPVTALVRVPPNGRELNQFFAKQALDQGALGIMFPTIETVEQARAAVTACRYPQTRDASIPEPVGQRGAYNKLAPRSWGLRAPEYYQRADLWPLNPAGELFTMFIVETALGARNVDEILENVSGVGGVMAGLGDMAYSVGAGSDLGSPVVEEAIQTVLAACLKHDVPCCAIAMNEEDARRRIEQGFRIIFSFPLFHDPVLAGLRKSS